MQQAQTAVVVLRLPQSLKDAIDEYAAQHDMSSSEAMRLACAGLVNYPYNYTHGNTVHATNTARLQADRQRKREARAQAKHRTNLIERLDKINATK